MPLTPFSAAPARAPAPSKALKPFLPPSLAAPATAVAPAFAFCANVSLRSCSSALFCSRLKYSLKLVSIETNTS